MGVGWKIVGKAEYELPPLELTRGEEKIFDELIQKLSESNNNDVKDALKQLCYEENLLLEKNEAQKIIKTVEMNFNGFGAFDSLLKDNDLEEITVTGEGEVRVYHRVKGWLNTNIFIEKKFVINTINKMARPLGRRLTLQKPRLNTVLPNGSRLHACISPIATSGVEVTIRRFRDKPFSIKELIENNTMSARCAAFLWTALYGDASVLVCGTTGSGKTTTLNSLFSFIPRNERIIITEETPEINIPHKHVVRIIANEELDIGLTDLVKDTLRMRPDRVIIGEVRDKKEVTALFDSLMAGQARGTYATFHATSSKDALKRLVSLGAGENDLDAIKLILVQKRINVVDGDKQREIRRVTELCEVHDGKTINVLENPSKSMVLSQLTENYNKTKKELVELIKKREKWLLKKAPTNHEEFFNEIQGNNS